jgi:hypothetical protein
MNKDYKEDLTGRRYGKLVVVKFHGRLLKHSDGRNKQSLPYWECSCDCGNILIIRGTGLTSHNTKSCGCLHKENAIKVGEVYPTKYGDITVIEKLPKDWFVVRFENGYEKKTTGKSIRTGKIKNCYKPHVKGIGYCGDGKFACKINGNNTKEYDIWSGILKRCYNAKFQQKHPTYIGCTVSEDWLDFQKFAEWYTSRSGYGKDYHLDKDLIKTGNKVYCPEYCSLVPTEINSLFTGSSRGVGERGVHWCKTKNKYIAQCHIGEVTAKGNPKQTYLGAYDLETDARKAYNSKKAEKILSLLDKYDGCLDKRLVENLMMKAKELLAGGNND